MLARGSSDGNGVTCVQLIGARLPHPDDAGRLQRDSCALLQASDSSSSSHSAHVRSEALGHAIATASDPSLPRTAGSSSRRPAAQAFELTEQDAFLVRLRVVSVLRGFVRRRLLVASAERMSPGNRHNVGCWYATIPTPIGILTMCRSSDVTVQPPS